MSARTTTASLFVLNAIFVLAGCAASEETRSPLGGGDAGTTVDAGSDAAPPPPPVDAGTRKRTVMTRAPFGGAPGNHLIDGDFEFSTVPHAGGQLGFRAFTADGNGEVDLATETGGLCRSGLRCAVFEPKTILFLRGASADGKGHVASGWVKPSGDSACSKVRPILITCDTFNVLKPLSAATGKGEDGWCHYTAAIGAQSLATCVYVESTLPTGATALVDAFVLGPDDGTVQPLAAESWVPEESTVMALENMREAIRRTLPLGRRPRPDIDSRPLR